MALSLVSACAIFAVLVPLAGCAKRSGILIAGSETMKDAIALLAQDFNRAQDRYIARVSGGGSKQGIEDLTYGRIDIAMTSNDINETHLAALADISKFEKVEIGYDGLAILVHPENPLRQIYLQQYANILSGKTTNWKELGGKDLPIIPVLRDRKSGTEAYVREHILRRRDLGEPVYAVFRNTEYAPHAVVKKNNQEIIEFVASHAGAIAYMGVGVAKAEGRGKVKILEYALTKEGPFLTPSIENIQSGKYRLARPLALVYVPSAKSDAFVAYALGEAGQRKILEYEYMQAAPTTVLVIEKRLQK
ncbi:MAG: substrate-binding domain-containing protein [Leptospiraceae bacterium]|nr:substrate-binding domain-containing protein [Leptospiraceae bacterium]